MELKVSIDAEAQSRLNALLVQMPDEVAAAVLRGIGKGSQVLQALAIKERYLGQGPFPISARRLGNVSGRLFRSIRFTKPQVESAGSVVVRAGSNVKYWAYHEYGFKGQVSVREARVKNTNNAFGQGRFSILAHTRRAHKRRVNYPGRAPLRAAIEEHSAREYSKAVKAEIEKLLN